LEVLLGLVGAKEDDERLLISFPPNTLKERDPQYDDRVYGNFSRNLQVFGAVLSGHPWKGPEAHRTERPCIHATYSGEVFARREPFPDTDSDFDFYGYNAKIRRLVGNFFYGATVTSVVPLEVSPTILDFGPSHMLNVLDLLDCLSGFGEVQNVSVVSGSLLDRRVSDVSYTLSPDRLVVQYHCSSKNLLQGDEWNWDSEVVVEFVPITPTRVPVVGGFYQTVYTYPTIYRFRRLSQTGWTGSVGRLEDDYVAPQPYWGFPIPLSTLDTYNVFDDVKNVERARNQFSLGVYLSNFEQAVGREWMSIVPSSSFSAVDAFLKAEGDLGVDSLQNLVKLPQIASALPKLKEALDVLSHLARRDLSLSTAKEIASLASSTILQANFQWAPYKRLLTEYLPLMVSSLQHLSDSSRKAVGYGSFRFQLHGQLGRDEVTLLTRTKIVMDTSALSLLSTFIGIDTIGVLPKPSNLWDLVPFSFVVNWFTGVGAAIKNAEYSLVLATVPAYFVHTYTLVSHLSDDELAYVGAASANSLPVSLRIYRRDVSIHSPFPRDSKFGFGLPTQLPPLGTVAALLYQLIFS
jgi:hypothetical protein